MKYEYRDIPEGINVTKVHPLREFFVLLSGAVILIFLIVFLLGISAEHLARFIPFKLEVKLSSSIELEEDSPPKEIKRYLESLKEKVIDVMDLPDGMTIKLHYSKNNTVNAFATLGGNVVLFRGLLRKLPNENALVMLLSHEIAHVKHRDPIVSLTRGLTISSVFSLIFGQTNLDILSNAGFYTMLHFSREMESKADEVALNTVHRIYGHTRGAHDLFKMIQEHNKQLGKYEELEFFQSHPPDWKRINAISVSSDENHWMQEGRPTPIPQEFFDSLEDINEPMLIK